MSQSSQEPPPTLVLSGPSLMGAACPLSSPIPVPVSSRSPSQTHPETGLPQLPASLCPVKCTPQPVFGVNHVFAHTV